MVILKDKKLNEQLVAADKQEFDLLKSQIDRNPMLKKMLTTPIREIPQYEFIHNEIYGAGAYPLLSLLEFFVIEGHGKLLFSKAGNNFIGFIIYVEKGRDITHIKMASFYDDRVKANGMIAKDLRNFIASEMPSHNKIEWEVDKDNKHAIAMYQEAIPKWFPQYRLTWDWSNKLNRWIYAITK